MAKAKTTKKPTKKTRKNNPLLGIVAIGAGFILALVMAAWAWSAAY